ncbi:tryptophan 7-halogenase [Maricaulis maris]|uniref:tryptophan halogenase family protein n=1 Tax=Maricaulis maris TaxID=74318 RepID=UPI0026EB3C63|nr:tryptophan 7-halogenase [Maricaulis maris]
MTGTISKVVIAGGGTAGWMTAAALSRFLVPSGVTVELVESERIGTVGVGEATIPGIIDFNRMLGIDEADFIAATKGTFKLGIEFVDWDRVGNRYLHPFGEYGFDLEGVPFHHYWLRDRLRGSDHPLSAYSMCCQAAMSGKFMRPVSDPQSPVAQMRHAYHFDAGLYARYLRNYAEQRGVTRVEGRIKTVDQSAETGSLTALELENGSRIEGDIFVDCTGFRALLIGETLGVDYDDWRRYLPCDRAIAVPCEKIGAAAPYTRATAREAGWQWRIPLQHRTGNGYVYSSAFLDDDEAERALLANLDAPTTGPTNRLRFTPGRRRSVWKKNCVAIGLSAGFLEPLESTSIHLIQEGVSKLLALFPRGGINQREVTRYNSIIGNAYDYVRDFLILHYNATTRDETPFWDYVRTMAVPDSLTETVELFAENGRFFAHKSDLFSITSWVAVMIGQGILPRGYDPVADSIPDQDLVATLTNMREIYAQAASKMPPHQAFIDHLAKSARQGGQAHAR